jgi:hypothetical protein
MPSKSWSRRLCKTVVQDTPLRSASWTTFFGQARAAQASPLRSEPRTTRDMRKFKNFSASPKISELRMSRKTLGVRNFGC